MVNYTEFYRNHVRNIKVHGQQAKGLCPFHEDKNPSFSFNIEDGKWKCFAGCGEGGYKTFQGKIRGEDRPMQPPPTPKVQKNGSNIPKKYQDIINQAATYVKNHTKKAIGDMPWSEELVLKLFIGYDPNNERYIFPYKTQ